jgi:type VI secretion system secreted protein VgrG
VDGHAGDGALVHFEYPAGVPTAEAAKARAERRLEQLQREQISVTARTDCIRVQPGRLLAIEGAADEIFQQRMLVAEARHRFARPLRDGGAAIAYGNEVSLRPTKSAEGGARPHHRPALPRKPALEHLDGAVITGAAGEEIHVDDLGRVKVRFLWDRAGPKDDRSSSWVRCLQSPLGAAMFRPRVGCEVTVGFLDGSPDQPFVLGRVYNATAVSPYALPAASATSAFQSWTTPKSGMTQEIKMSDDAGTQAMAIHASKDFSVKVGGSRKTTVGGDMDHSVGLSLTSNVLGSRSVDVGAMQTVNVGKEILLSVGGASSESIAAAEIIGVSGNRALSAGASCVELVGGGYTLLCNQSNVKVSGVSTRAVIGSNAIAAGLGMTESVAAGRAYVCLGSRTVSCGAYAESITGGKRSKAGVVNENAVGIAASAPSWTVKPGSLTVTASGKVTLSAPSITIEVSGSLTAGPLKMSGGALRTTSGTLAVSGNTSRPRGGEVGS